MGKNRGISNVQMILTVIFVSALMITNVITAKQVLLPFNITTTGGLFIFPITYVLSDLFSEIYGYRWSRVTCYMAFFMNLLMVLFFTVAINSPAPDYWTEQEAFQTVLGHTPKVLVASLTAFILGDFVNDKVFSKMKEKFPESHEEFGKRAIFSSLCGEVVDSLIFFPIAFYGELPLSALWGMMLTEVIIKTGYEVVVLPITKLCVKKVSQYEEKNIAYNL